CVFESLQALRGTLSLEILDQLAHFDRSAERRPVVQGTKDRSPERPRDPRSALPADSSAFRRASRLSPTQCIAVVTAWRLSRSGTDSAPWRGLARFGAACCARARGWAVFSRRGARRRRSARPGG